MWSEVEVAHATAEYNSGRMRAAAAAKKLAVRRNALRREASEYIGYDSRCPVTCKRVSALWFENGMSITKYWF
jgi:hypothetical protein